MTLPAVVVLGCVVKVSVAGAAAVILNAVLVMAGRPADRGRQRIARAGFDELQVAEGGHAVDGLHGKRALQRVIPRVGAQRQRDGGRSTGLP